MTKELDLLVVNAGGFRKRVYQDLSKNLSAIEPPFWAALTAGFVRKNGYGVEILDANAENLDREETVQRIYDANPRLTAIVVYGQHPSASTQLMTEAGNLSRGVKESNPLLKVILTGLHPSALPKRTLGEEVCDYVCEGEGFYTLLGLLENRALGKIPGLWWREEGESRHTKRARNVENLDNELGDVAWDLLPMEKYLAYNWQCLGDLDSRKNYASISTSLGCPFSCDFCTVFNTFGERRIRYWSSEWALKQLDILSEKYGVKNIKIIDELFIFNPKHYMPIAEGLIERGHKFNISAFTRIDTIKKQTLKKLKRAGFEWLAPGIESGSEKIRKNVSKGQFSEQDTKEIVGVMKDEGINVVGHCMFGLPGDTLESMQENLDFAMELNTEWNTMYCVSAYPGSPLYNQMLNKGVELPKKWEDYAQHSYDFLPLPTDTLIPKQILKFRDDAFNTYYTNPNYLKMIENKFGLKAREHIEGMTKIKLKRKLLGD